MTTKKAILWLALFILLAALAWLGVGAVRAANAARLALADLDRLQTLADGGSPAALPALSDDLAALETHLSTVRSAGRPFLWLASKQNWVPRYGSTLAAAPALLDMGVALAGGGREALDALKPLTAKLGGGQRGDLLAEALPIISAAAPQLQDADARLARAQALRATIAGNLHPRLAEQLPRLDRLLPLARAGLQAAQVAPALLGADGPRTYLILAQNSHELRGTGGFISGAGFIRLEGGRIIDLKLSDAYSVDDLTQSHPAPPRTLTEQTGIQLLTLRDSNWSPDFLESGEVARALFAQDRGIATDGVIALDLEAVRLLVAALEPLQVPGVDQPVTGANALDWMMRSWEAPQSATGTVKEASTSDWFRKRKDFMAELMTAALAKLQSGGDLNASALAQAAVAMLDGRHLQVAVDDPALAKILAEQGWDGSLHPPAEGDFLAVVDSNVGFNKANAAVTEAIAYRVEPANGALDATLTLTYTHTAPAGAEPICDRSMRYGDSYDEIINRCYWDYLRVYVPGGSELLEATGLNRPVSEQGEHGTTVFAGSFSLRPGDQHDVTLRYRLPEDIPLSPYRLFVRKQAGTLAPPLTVEAGECRWVTDLSVDRVFVCGGKQVDK
jgi:hypothetical protein